MANELRAGQTRPGILVDGLEETLYLACNLTYEPRRGPLVEVPYVPDAPQFKVAQAWFRQQETPPGCLSFHDPEGDVTLTGVRWRGNRGIEVAIGRLDARVAIFGRAQHLMDEFRLKTVRSRIDGLREFAAFESIHTEHERTDGQVRTLVTVHAKDEMRVQHDAITYRIRATTPGSTSGREVAVRADAVVETTKEAGATVDEHIEAQWPLRALLTLAFGVPLYWREHQLLDEQFPTWMVGGPPRGPMHVPLLFERTVRDHEHPEVGWHQLALPMFDMGDLGEEGLVRWFTLYADPVFSRAVEPAVEVINGGAGDFVEPRLTLTMFALDALGYYLDTTRTPKVPLRDQIERCLDVPAVDWSQVGRPGQIAQALAHVNNDLKHPDRGHRPDTVAMGLAADLAIVILRLRVAHSLGVDDALIHRLTTMPAFRNTLTAFERNGVRIQDGRFVRETA